MQSRPKRKGRGTKTYIDFFLISKHKKYIYLKVYWIVNKSTLRSTLKLNKNIFSHGLFLFSKIKKKTSKWFYLKFELSLISLNKTLLFGEINIVLEWPWPTSCLKTKLYKDYDTGLSLRVLGAEHCCELYLRVSIVIYQCIPLFLFGTNYFLSPKRNKAICLGFFCKALWMNYLMFT